MRRGATQNNTLAAVVYAICFVSFTVGAVWLGCSGHPWLAFALILCSGCMKIKVGGGVCE